MTHAITGFRSGEFEFTQVGLIGGFYFLCGLPGPINQIPASPKSINVHVLASGTAPTSPALVHMA
jgi:hypothetical protein